MKRFMISAAVCAALGAAEAGISNNASDFNQPGRFYLTPTVGAFWDFSANPNSAPAFGLAGGYNLTDQFAVELAGGGWDQGATGRVDGIWNIPTGTNFRPYLAAGAGYVNITESAFAIDAGAGLKYYVAENFNLNINYRHLQAIRAPGMRNGALINGGFSFAFGHADTVCDDCNTFMSKKEKTMHQKYALPESVRECDDNTPPDVLESVGCYTVRGDKVTMHLDAKYDFDKSTLRDSSKKALDNVASFMKQYPNTNVTLKGYASPEGTKTYNQKLSERRAAAAQQYLINHGVAPQRIGTVGYGETRPLLSNDTERGREANRRVQTAIDVPLKKQANK